MNEVTFLDVEELGSIGIERQAKAFGLNGAARESHTSTFVLFVVGVPSFNVTCFILYTVIRFQPKQPIQL